MTLSRNDTTTHQSYLIFGLLIKCPFGKTKSQCPISVYRQDSSLEEKFLLACQFSTNQLQQLISHHEACFKGRLQSMKDGIEVTRLGDANPGRPDRKMSIHKSQWGDRQRSINSNSQIKISVPAG